MLQLWALTACALLTATAVCMGLLPFMLCATFPEQNPDMCVAPCAPDSPAALTPRTIQLVVWCAGTALAWMLAVRFASR
jgi:hypothetical protein